MSAPLPDPLPFGPQYSAKNWISVPYVEEARRGSTSGEAAFGGSGAASSCVRTYFCYFDDRYTFHKEILGWAERVPASTIVQLSRRPPMQDPEFDSLYATRITRSVPYGQPFGKVTGTYTGSPYTNYPYAMVTVLFEQVTYDILADAQMGGDLKLADGTYDESYRYTTWEHDYSTEFISKPAQEFQFLAADPPSPKEFVQTRGQLFANDHVAVTWHDVPEIGLTGYIGYTGGTHQLNANIRDGFGKINNADWRGYPKGTLLFLGAKTTNKSSCLRNADVPGIVYWEQPRFVDVRFLFAWRDPPTTGGYAYRGWNLFPWVGDDKWYLATRDGLSTGTKLYPEYDFTKLFKLI